MYEFAQFLPPIDLMESSIPYLLLANIFLVCIFAVVCKRTRYKEMGREERTVFLALSRYAPLLLTATHTYLLVFALPLFLVSTPVGLYTNWLLGNVIVILLWIYVKFHYLRPIEKAYRKIKVAP